MPFVYLAAVIGSAVGAAEGAVVLKRFPDVPPIVLNAVAMAVGTASLFAVSLLIGETWKLPNRAATWYSLAFLIPIGSVALFILYVYVVQHWTASGASYQFVLFPVVTAVTGALVADERLSAAVAAGGVLVIAGTYVGALASAREQSVVPAEPL